tara:strand:+ start:63 stop:374 length:312 start_codon:yes stop_codon:yes gene_type:complete
MIVVNPTDTIHTFSIVPRFTPDVNLTLSLYNEVERSTEDISNSYYMDNGNLNIKFTKTFTDKGKWSIKISQVSEVIYRGKIFSTTQDPQDYKITNGLYIYTAV